MFNRGITIIVEKTSEYDNWKTIGDGKTVYLNIDVFDNAEFNFRSPLSSLNSGDSQTVKVLTPEAIARSAVAKLNIAQDIKCS